MTVLELPARPAAAPIGERPVFLDATGRRQRRVERALVVVLVVALLFLGTACYALT